MEKPTQTAIQRDEISVKFHPTCTTPTLQNKIPVAQKGDYIFLDFDEIQYISSEGSYARIYTLHNSFLTSKNLKHYEGALQGSGFFRISNCRLVNMNKVRMFIQEDGGLLELQSGDRLAISRSKRKEVRCWLNI